MKRRCFKNLAILMVCLVLLNCVMPGLTAFASESSKSFSPEDAQALIDTGKISYQMLEGKDLKGQVADSFSYTEVRDLGSRLVKEGFMISVDESNAVRYYEEDNEIGVIIEILFKKQDYTDLTYAKIIAVSLTGADEPEDVVAIIYNEKELLKAIDKNGKTYTYEDLFYQGVLSSYEHCDTCIDICGLMYGAGGLLTCVVVCAPFAGPLCALICGALTLIMAYYGGQNCTWMCREAGYCP